MKRGTPQHPKVAQLAALLNEPLYGAVGILEMLWHFTAKYAPRGDIGRYSDAAIAKAVGWEKRSGSRGVRTEVRLSSALVQAGFLDSSKEHRLVVHDWSDHADQQVTRMLARHGLAFVQPKNSSALAYSHKPEPNSQLGSTENSRERHIAKAHAKPQNGFLDELWQEYKSETVWLGYTDEDYAKEYVDWKILDPDQKRAAITGQVKLRESGADPQYIRNKYTWIKNREWKRKPPEKPKSKLERIMESI